MHYIDYSSLVVVSAQLRASGAKGETRFFASLSREALLAGERQVSRHEKKRYPRDQTLPDFNSLGLDPITGDAFSTTLTSQAIRP